MLHQGEVVAGAGRAVAGSRSARGIRIASHKTESAIMIVRRFALVLSIVFCGSLALAAAAVAAGGMGPGKYTFHSSSANAFFGMGKKGGPPSASWSVNLNHGLNSFKPTQPTGPLIVKNITIASLPPFADTRTVPFT